MENKIIIGNMKMYMNIEDVNNYITKLDNYDNVILCPSNIYMNYYLEKKYRLGIQNIYYEDNGAYTGEISAIQAKKMGVEFAIIGHSERRKYFLETDSDVSKKLIKALENGLNAILCIGEDIDNKNSGNTNNILVYQLEMALDSVNSKYENNIIIAYEPKWAIGTGLIPSNNEIINTVDFIKSYILDKYKMNVKVIYGGSITDSNIELLSKINNVDGFMIGGACTNPDKFLKIISVINGSDK